mmetsp:Transcript_13516/g.22478  ORF Transcript_13516/g.22478 Transcript_13516/m.22478 type:complete len:256 (-) Transcript_13516:1496-2263(-)
MCPTRHRNYKAGSTTAATALRRGALAAADPLDRRSVGQVQRLRGGQEPVLCCLRVGLHASRAALPIDRRGLEQLLRDLLTAPLMERVHPRDLLVRHELQVDECPAHGHGREVPETEVRPRAPSVACGGGFSNEVGLDADAETMIALLVKARLVGEVVPLLDGRKVHPAHAGRLDNLGRVHCAAADAKRPLVHVEKSTDAVPRAVQEVHPILPERTTREHLEHNPRSTSREDRLCEGDVALKHTCVRTLLVLGRDL